MIADLLIGGFMGFFACLLLLIVCAGIFAAIYFTVNKDYKYYIRIRNMSGGKAVMQWVKAKKIKHPKLGLAYYMPKLKSQNMALAPCFGSEYEYPLGKRWHVALTYYSEEWAPERYDPMSSKVEHEIIKQTSPGVFQKIKEEIPVYILRPVPKSIRKWILDADRISNEENPIKLSWFERNKEFIAIVVIAILTTVICFMAILFSFQYGIEVINNPPQTPQWAIDLLNASLNQSMSVPPQFG